MPAEPNRASPRQVLGSTPEVLAEALREETNLAVWRRQLPGAVQAFVAQLAAQPGPLAESIALHCGAEDAAPDLSHLLAGHTAREGYAEFIADVAWLVSACGCLLGARRIGLRLRLLECAMCPRFHVDQVPLRLVTTYFGPGSQWCDGRPEATGTSVHALSCGDVALLKGERWAGNEGRGLLHRSPPVAAGERRLLLTLDWLA